LAAGTLDHLISVSDVRNVASHRIMAKLGMRRVDDVITATRGRLRVDRLNRADWLALVGNREG